eukprot:TRINITY_DN6883_c0_g1_i1.p1 TRINITY_DN6883_c0_g1~~TRINITY_DN6883_c0_g1_i1.p1  ORF type:complete len:406 (-),score=92.96 TRINITY_DN6883_c0_g1_i1:71-1288(-)
MMKPTPTKVGQKRAVLPPLSTPSTPSTPLRTSKTQQGQGQGKITIHDASSFLFSDDSTNINNSTSDNNSSLSSPLRGSGGMSGVEGLSASTTTTSTGVVYNLPVRVVRYDGPRFRKGGGATVVQPKVTASHISTPQKSITQMYQSVLELEEEEDDDTNEPTVLTSSSSSDVLIEEVNKILPNHTQQHHSITSVLTSRLSIVQQAKRFWLCGDYIGALSSTLFSSYSLPLSQNSIVTPDLAIQGDTEMTYLVLSKILKQNSECLTLECTETLMSAVDRLLKYGKKREGTLALRVGCILVELYRDLADVITRLENTFGVESVTPVMRGKSIALRKYLVSKDGLSKSVLDHSAKIKEDSSEGEETEILEGDLESEAAESEQYYKKWKRRLGGLIDELRGADESKAQKT